MESELLGEMPVCSLAEPVHWQFLTLLDTVGRRNGQVLVMEMDDIHEAAPLVQMDFAQELFRGINLKTKLHRKKEIKEEEQEVQPQLVFMLWQAATLRQLMQWEHLDETLWNLRNLFPCMPAALVLVMIQSDLQHQQVEPERAAGALRRMQCLLDGGFQELVVEAAVYSPGQPDGTLEVKRAACRALREVLKGQEVLGLEARLRLCADHQLLVPVRWGGAGLSLLHRPLPGPGQTHLQDPSLASGSSMDIGQAPSSAGSSTGVRGARLQPSYNSLRTPSLSPPTPMVTTQ
uniref:C2orf72-like C-terminal domain-containing protein n=1 Tax=Gopherus agassizii TaxID=38772 RepID=A0A452GLF3_9SAUR